ncbi:ABC transporter ATP-binding protein [Chthonobacter albigriseus]|uniref:ABC transporter ATP-binding protein n=1 Tax=Chthonobacter albigriseus TaxID=1683161 RepID=UPI0015EF27A9|nr:ABC transporter ATP-binding protein [Chthonobacter albigriseus]
MSVPIMTLDKVRKSYGDSVAVHSIDLEIAKGEFIALMGPSGCGKTTTLRMLAGLDKPSAGEIRMWSRVMNDVPAWERDTPMVWQSYALFPFLSVLENVEFGLKQRRTTDAVGRRAKAMEWLDRLGIAGMAGRGIDQLSGGQRQRVALARALALEPEVLLLDEPLSALDAHLRVRMQTELARLHGELGITFVYVTHTQSEAFAMANRIVIMSEGRVQQIGTPQDIYRAPATRFVAEFIGASNILSGTLKESGAGGIVIENALGRFRSAGATGIAVGQDAAFVIAADKIALTRAADPAEPGLDAVTGTVAAEEFIGAVVTIHVDLPDGRSMFVQKQQNEVGRLGLARGDEVRLAWHPQDTFVIPG